MVSQGAHEQTTCTSLKKRALMITQLRMLMNRVRIATGSRTSLENQVVGLQARMDEKILKMATNFKSLVIILL